MRKTAITLSYEDFYMTLLVCGMDAVKGVY